MEPHVMPSSQGDLSGRPYETRRHRTCQEVDRCGDEIPPPNAQGAESAEPKERTEHVAKAGRSCRITKYARQDSEPATDGLENRCSIH